MSTNKKTGYQKAKSRLQLTPADMLKILREKNELSQNELAKITGINQSTISSIENGRVNIGVERAKTFAKALHVHPAVLVFPDWESETDLVA